MICKLEVLKLETSVLGGKKERKKRSNRCRFYGFQGHTANGSDAESRVAPFSGLVNDSELTACQPAGSAS